MSREDYNERALKAGRLTLTKISDVIQHWQADRGLVADGYFGEASDAEWRRQFAPMSVAQGEPSRLAKYALKVAVDELGNGEEFENNAGEHLHRYRDYPYRDDYERPIGEWCAFFVGYCFEQAAARASIRLPFKRRWHDPNRNRKMPVGSAKNLGKRIAKAGSEVSVESVRAGDVMVWDRGRSGSPAGHIGIVERVDPDERIVHTIEGNVGGSWKREPPVPAVVMRRQWDMDRPGRLELVARV